jgi:hypothetical protein
MGSLAIADRDYPGDRADVRHRLSPYLNSKIPEKGRRLFSEFHGSQCCSAFRVLANLPKPLSLL